MLRTELVHFRSDPDSAPDVKVFLFFFRRDIGTVPIKYCEGKEKDRKNEFCSRYNVLPGNYLFIQYYLYFFFDGTAPEPPLKIPALFRKCRLRRAPAPHHCW